MAGTAWPVSRLVAAGCGGIALLATLFVGAPALLEWALSGDSPRQRTASADAERTVAEFLSRELGELGAARSGTADDSAQPADREIYRLPPGATAKDAAQRIQVAARAAGVELHTAPIGDLDVLVLVYAGKQLSNQLILRQAPSALHPAPAAPTLRERPLVAVIVSGLGERPPGDLITLPVPLTLAIRPYQPWSLRTAEEGMSHWHEVLVDLEAADTAPTPSEQLHAVPYASGVLIRSATAALPTSGDLPHGIVVHTQEAPIQPMLKPLSALAPTGAPATEALARAWGEATRDGVATVVLSSLDPTFPDAVQSMLQADTLGYRLVLASEAARWQDIRGIPSAETEQLNR